MPTHLVIDATNPCVEMIGCQFRLLLRRFTGYLSTEAHPRQNQMTILFCASFEQGHDSTVSALSREILVGTFLVGRDVSLRLSFFPDGSGIPLPVTKLLKDIWVQAEDVFSSSAQCTEARQ